MDYLYLRAWAEIMDYSPEELEEYLAQARKDKAPENALFPMSMADNWHTTEILAPDLLLDISQRVAQMKAHEQRIKFSSGG